jgi:hypothetical protein
MKVYFKCNFLFGHKNKLEKRFGEKNRRQAFFHGTLGKAGRFPDSRSGRHFLSLAKIWFSQNCFYLIYENASSDGFVYGFVDSRVVNFFLILLHFCPWVIIYLFIPLFDRLWSTFGSLGQLWSALVSFGQLWSTLVNFGQLWSTLVNFGQLWVKALRWPLEIKVFAVKTYRLE